MAAAKYIVEYYIDWDDGTPMQGTVRFQIKNLQKIFDSLYEKVILGAIKDPELYDPSMIIEVWICITKVPTGKIISKSP